MNMMSKILQIILCLAMDEHLGSYSQQRLGSSSKICISLLLNEKLSDEFAAKPLNTSQLHVQLITPFIL